MKLSHEKLFKIFMWCFITVILLLMDAALLFFVAALIAPPAVHGGGSLFELAPPDFTHLLSFVEIFFEAY